MPTLEEEEVLIWSGVILSIESVVFNIGAFLTAPLTAYLQYVLLPH